jgi:hypothetical protein
MDQVKGISACNDRDEPEVNMNLINRRRRMSRSAALLALILAVAGQLPSVAMAGDATPAREQADAWLLAQAVTLAIPEADATGIHARAIGREELSRQHGKGATQPAANGTRGVAVILWDERGATGGQTTRVSMTGTGNVQNTSLTLSVR